MLGNEYGKPFYFSNNVKWWHVLGIKSDLQVVDFSHKVADEILIKNSK